MAQKNSKYSKLKRGIRRRTLFFLSLALMANAFAWFIYSNKVSNSITASVKSWRITFAQDGTDLENNVTFDVSSIYPGMTNYVDTVDISNSGEMAANIRYEIKSVKVFDDTYTSSNYTSAQMESILRNNYPFTITFAVDHPTIGVSGTAHFSMTVSWPYESGNDELDTLWGKRSYTFQTNNPGVDEIEINVKITATQD
ncbi:MAG: hypothetical protein IKF82_08115 [Bacilli bacterium]|nr:hypothetical protein [Bacilli bacterium]